MRYKEYLRICYQFISKYVGYRLVVLGSSLFALIAVVTVITFIENTVSN